MPRPKVDVILTRDILIRVEMAGNLIFTLLVVI